MWLPVALTSDERAAKGVTAMQLRNVYVEKNADSADKRKPYMLVSVPGKRKRLTLGGGVCRGVFFGDHVAGSSLFAVGGTTLYAIDTSWTATSLGSIVGSRPVVFSALETDLLLLGEDTLYRLGGMSDHWADLTGSSWEMLSGETWDQLDGTLTLSAVTHENLPANPETLAVLAERAIVSDDGSDTMDWSSVGNATSWPASGFATSQARPDVIVGQFAIGQYLYSGGAETFQFWRGVGGTDDSAFDTLGIEPVERGLLSRHAGVRVDNTLMFVGDDRTFYEMTNFTPSPKPNRDLELALQKPNTGTDPADNLIVFTYRDGSKLFAGARLAAGPAYVLDVGLGAWHERHTYEGDAWDGGFSARFNGYTVIGSPDSADIWTYDADVYADDATTLERTMSLFLPISGPLTLTSIVFDMKVFGQPLSGGGSNPQAMIKLSKDNGRTWSTERSVYIGASGDTTKTIKTTNWGRFDGRNGALINIRITDPVGFALYGVYINEDPTN